MSDLERDCDLVGHKMSRRTNADGMYQCLGCKFECEHDRDELVTEDEGIGLYEYHGEVSTDVDVHVYCNRCNADVTQIARDLAEMEL